MRRRSCGCPCRHLVGPTDAAGGATREAYLGNRWYTFDARHNHPRLGRIVMARGRDATDVATSTTFGPCVLTGFTVIADELPGAD